jgi:branched-chain amino acid transport system ATP-binding protein
MSALLAIDALSVSFGRVNAVTEVTLRLDPAEIVAVIGANGAGKSTLLNAVMGLRRARGALTLDGRRIERLQVETRVGLGMCLVPERRELFGAMSVEDNLLLGAFRLSRAEAPEAMQGVFARFPRLLERRRQLAHTLSGGEQQMLAIGRALMSRPRLLMLDEPSLGLAPRIAADIFAIVGELRAAGVSILLVEQNARAALKLADRGYVMELGRVVMQGPAAELAQDPRVVESYLGRDSL